MGLDNEEARQSPETRQQLLLIPKCRRLMIYNLIIGIWYQNRDQDQDHRIRMSGEGKERVASETHVLGKCSLLRHASADW